MTREMDKKYYKFLMNKLQQKQRIYKVMCGNTSIITAERASPNVSTAINVVEHNSSVN